MLHNVKVDVYLYKKNVELSNCSFQTIRSAVSSSILITQPNTSIYMKLVSDSSI